jgi:hypothetical protein
MLSHLPVLHQETATRINRSVNIGNKNTFSHATTVTALRKYTKTIFFSSLNLYYTGTRALNPPQYGASGLILI